MAWRMGISCSHTTRGDTVFWSRLMLTRVRRESCLLGAVDGRAMVISFCEGCGGFKNGPGGLPRPKGPCHAAVDRMATASAAVVQTRASTELAFERFMVSAPFQVIAQ